MHFRRISSVHTKLFTLYEAIEKLVLVIIYHKEKIDLPFEFSDQSEFFGRKKSQ